VKFGLTGNKLQVPKKHKLIKQSHWLLIQD